MYGVNENEKWLAFEDDEGLVWMCRCLNNAGCLSVTSGTAECLLQSFAAAFTNPILTTPSMRSMMDKFT